VTLPCPAPADVEPPDPPLGMPSVAIDPDVAALAGDSGTIAPEQADEPALVAKIKEGREGAFDVLVKRYLRRAHAVAFRMLRHEEDAEDVVQDAFLRALDRIDQCAPGRAFGPWFFRILITQALNSRRSQKVRATDELSEDVHHGDDAPDMDAERAEIRARFAAALATLPEKQRMVVELSEIEGFSSGEVAEMLEMPAGTVRWHLHQARTQLRQALASLRPRHER
jgi:RNA polymerase sigma-70 factor (ECF subfamily)